MSFPIRSNPVDIECSFCGKQFRLSLRRLVHDSAAICPSCASLAEFDADEITAIISAITIHIKIRKHPAMHGNREHK